MHTSAIDDLLGQLRATAAQLELPGFAKPAAPAAGGDFAAVLKASLDQANHAQLEAARLARAFETGAPGANLSDVMIALQKANISFQEIVQVRDKLVSAYNDVMNMQV
ncbi:MAG: flagellar hook-basal body complex protein FliE [Betaproteobacteria bacterium]|nr:flagellar hook-basal body complex protein FliE [Betaproteobacteria bacterium]